VRRENDVGEAATAAIEDNVFNFADVLTLGILDLGTNDGATLNIPAGGSRTCAGLSKQRSRGDQQGQRCSEQDILFHKL
jgi:hypothetical protein